LTLSQNGNELRGCYDPQADTITLPLVESAPPSVLTRRAEHDLEESLLEYRGALVLVTHDRFLLDRVSTVVLGLDGMGQAERFADYSQWEEWQRSEKAAKRMSGLKDGPRSKEVGNGSKAPARAQKKLSYQESRELAGIERRITEAEQELQIRHKALEDPEVMGDHVRLQNVLAEMAKAQKIVDALYARWSELEQEQG
jgi:ATP-binding cassette subfamily F protein uup